MNISENITQAIKNALTELSIDAAEITLEHPADLSHGDYSTNVALVYAKQLKTSPKTFAEKIVGRFMIHDSGFKKNIEKIEIAGAGFINFHLTKAFFTESVQTIIKEGENFGKNNSLNKAKTIIEFTDPNPFKEFHIGHLMSNAIGESISRLIEANGAEVKRACYQGDVGLHVAKTIWYLKKNIHPTDGKGKIMIFNSPSVLGMAYSNGDEAYRNDPVARDEIIEINKEIYSVRSFDENDLEGVAHFSAEWLYKKGKKISLAYFETIYKKLGTKFDYYFFESETGKFGKEIVEKNTPNIFEKSDGAVVFKAEKYDPMLHTRVFINKEGLPTYEAKELGLANIKYKEYPYDRSIVITGNEINQYFKVLLKAMEMVYPDLAKKTDHLSHGMLRLPTGKMSSRTGNVITAESLLGQIREVLIEKIADRTYSETQKAEILDKITVGSVKFSILKQATGSDIIYDFDKSISFEGDSGPYLQYSCVRARSIVAKAPHLAVQPPSQGISELERMLYRFPEVVERAGREYAPHYVATYLLELAAAFNNYYANNKIIDETDSNSAYKVALTHAFSIVIANGLKLLGIEVPEKM